MPKQPKNGDTPRKLESDAAKAEREAAAEDAAALLRNVQKRRGKSELYWTRCQSGHFPREDWHHSALLRMRVGEGSGVYRRRSPFSLPDCYRLLYRSVTLSGLY